MLPNYYSLTGVGRAKYVVNYHNGEKKRADSSPFYDCHISKTKKDHLNFIKFLKTNGYVERINQTK